MGSLVLILLRIEYLSCIEQMSTIYRTVIAHELIECLCCGSCYEIVIRTQIKYYVAIAWNVVLYNPQYAQEK